MQFRVGSSTYDKDGLPNLGSGSYGEVVDLGAKYAAKIYYDRPSSDQLSKLLRLFDIGAALAIDPEMDSTIAMPLQPAIDTNDGLVSGFAMKCFRNWLRLSQLTFDPANNRFKEAAGFSFNDATAVQAVFTLFKLLAALARRHIAIGDISAANILVNPKSATPGLIDMDSVHVEDWESNSLGTVGYVDPNLLDSDRNASGGLHFNAKSDVFAMTVIGFSLTVGFMPFYFGVHPPLKEEEFSRKRISSLRVIVEGTAFLDRLGLKLANPDDIREVQARLAALRAVRGQSGRDGEILCDHFVDVLVHGGRQNLIERLPDEDARNPAYDTVRRLRGLVAIRELEEKFGAKQLKPAPSPVLPKGLARTQAAGKPFIPRDPKAFQLFLAARGIDTQALVS